MHSTQPPLGAHGGVTARRVRVESASLTHEAEDGDWGGESSGGQSERTNERAFLTCMQLAAELTAFSFDRISLDFTTDKAPKHTTQNQTQQAKRTRHRQEFTPDLKESSSKIQSSQATIMHNTCPKCSAAIAGGSKTCGSCGSVRQTWNCDSTIKSNILWISD